MQQSIISDKIRRQISYFLVWLQISDAWTKVFIVALLVIKAQWILAAAGLKSLLNWKYYFQRVGNIEELFFFAKLWNPEKLLHLFFKASKLFLLQFLFLFFGLCQGYFVHILIRLIRSCSPCFKALLITYNLILVGCFEEISKM